MPPARGGCRRPLRRSWFLRRLPIRLQCRRRCSDHSSASSAPLHPANESPKRIAFYGTDLGFTYEHAGELKILFGDTSATGSGDPIEASTGERLDDGFGSIELARWPDPAKIAAGNLPLVRLGQNPGTTEMSAIDVGHRTGEFQDADRRVQQRRARVRALLPFEAPGLQQRCCVQRARLRHRPGLRGRATRGTGRPYVRLRGRRSVLRGGHDERCGG